MWITYNNWTNGIVGDKLIGNRNNQIYASSAKDLLNCYVTDTATLMCMKDYDVENVNVTGKLIQVIQTRFKFYIAFYTDKIVTFFEDGTKDVHLATSDENANISVFAENKIAVIHQGVSNFYQFDKFNGEVTAYDFFKEISPPLKDREVVRMDVHKIFEKLDYEGNKYKTIEKIADTITDPKIIVEEGGKVVIENVAGNVTRIYGEPLTIFRLVEGEPIVPLNYDWSIVVGEIEATKYGYEIDVIGTIVDGSWDENTGVSTIFADNTNDTIYISSVNSSRLYNRQSILVVFDGVNKEFIWNTTDLRYELVDIDLTAIFFASLGGAIAINIDIVEDTTAGDIYQDNVEIGDIIINFPNYLPTNLLFNTDPVRFINPEVELNRVFYEGLDANPGRGILYMGTVIDLQNKLVSLSVFQNRLVVADDMSVYFSKINDYSNFTNYIDDDSPFYVRPPLISDYQPRINKIYSSKGLFILTDRGIYSMSFNKFVTPNSMIEIVSDMPCKNICQSIDTTLFFIGEDGYLYSLQELIQSNSSLYQFTVNKYDYEKIKFVSSLRVGKYNRLLSQTEDGKLYIIDVIGPDEFRKTRFQLTGNQTGRVIGIHLDIHDDFERFNHTDRNFTMFSVTANKAAIYTETGGTLANDYNSKVKILSCRVLSTEPAEKVYLNGIKVTDIGRDKGLFILKTNLSAEIDLGFTIYPAENGECELVALEFNFIGAGRY